MQALSEDGQKSLADIAARHGVSSDAAAEVLSALVAGNGRQAQFNHPELGGMGQWSQGGMIMVGDMFNSGLKARVAALCEDLAGALHSSALFVPEQPSASSKSSRDPQRQRWPAELGSPSSSGSQNDMHYAVFPDKRRLAVEQHGRVTVYDTGDHRISGVSQQQSGEQSLRFTSQAGTVRLSDLNIVTGQARTGDSSPANQEAPHLDKSKASSPAPEATSDESIFSRLERLADLRSRDIITAEEFAAKKAELLARL